MIPLKNVEIRQAAKKAQVPMWRVARSLGCSENTLTRRLRDEFTPETKAEILGIIAQIAEERRTEESAESS